MTSESERTTEQAKAIHAAIDYANNYTPKGKSMTEYAADNEMTNEQAEKLISLGREMMI